jgi:hypothetical protein
VHLALYVAMQSHNNHLTTLFAFARCATAGIFTRDSLESPYGLTLTSDSILASRYNASGSVEVVRYPTSPEYRAYYTNAVDNYDKSTIQRSDAELPAHVDARTMFRQIITPITTSLTKREGHKPIYASLFLPSIFDHDIRGVATDVVFEGAYLQRAAFVGSSQIAACNAYPFLKGKRIGRAPDECNDHGPENLILLLEYEKDYLYAWVKDVSFDLGTYPVTNQKICMECGEKFREVRHTTFFDQFATNTYNRRLASRHMKSGFIISWTKSPRPKLCITTRVKKYERSSSPVTHLRKVSLPWLGSHVMR